ncbi:MAG TPA: two-component system regulatory protein YycI [Clostridia bacterium]|nr:two-component system regulatory protein YycI [Clostridia bacterium]
MDWARAKSILIFVFLMLNIFLFVNLRPYYHNSDDTVKSISVTKKILRERGYVLGCSIPEDFGKAAMIDYQRAQLDRKTILDKLLGHIDVLPEIINNTVEFSKGKKKLTFAVDNNFHFQDQPDGKLDVGNQKETEKYILKYLKSLDLGVTDFYLDYASTNSNKSVTYVFNEKYKDFLLYSSFITVMVSDKGVTDIQSYFIKVKSLTYTNTKIVPAYQVLIKNFIKGNKSVIRSIDLGFRGLHLGEKGEFSENVVWRVKTGDGTKTPRYFSIIDGQPLD